MTESISTGLDEVPFSFIQREFKETLGYVRQDIAKILDDKLGLNYTIALLACCACEMLAWHREDESYRVFTSLLPDVEQYKVIGKVLWEALRNGLAHKFRPDTIKIDGEEWRFQLYSQPGPAIAVSAGEPNWIRMNIRTISERVIAQITTYENELRNDAVSRQKFKVKSENFVRQLPADASKISAALRAIRGKTYA